MKKLSVLLVAACLVVACNNKKAKPGENNKKENTSDTLKEHINPSVQLADTASTTSKWAEATTREFISNCARSARSNKVDSIHALNYCKCMQQKLEERFPDIREAQAADMNSPEMTKMMESCMKNIN